MDAVAYAAEAVTIGKGLAMFKSLLMCGVALTASSVIHAQIPVVGGPVDIDGAVLTQRCIDAGVARENVSLRACVEDARSRAMQSVGLSAPPGTYRSALSSVSVAVPVVAKDSRTFLESASGRFPVSGTLVMKAGNTCAFQTYSIEKPFANDPMQEPRIESKQGTFSCSSDGSPLLPPL